MRKFPTPIHNAVAALGRLPGVGPKTALRYAFALLRLSKYDLDSIARAIVELKNVTTCEVCHAHAERSVCDICSDTTRSDDVLCVISESRDISTIEATQTYCGKYFVLGGVLNPIDGHTPDTLNVAALVTRLQFAPQIAEVILAFSPTSTAKRRFYISPKPSTPFTAAPPASPAASPWAPTLSTPTKSLLHRQ